MDILYEISKQLSFKYKMLIKVLSKKLYEYVKIYEIEKKYALIAKPDNIIHFPDLVVLYILDKLPPIYKNTSSKYYFKIYRYFDEISSQLKAIYLYYEDNVLWNIYCDKLNNLELLYTQNNINISTLREKTKLKHLIGKNINIDLRPEILSSIIKFKLKTLVINKFVVNNTRPFLNDELINLIKNMPLESVKIYNGIAHKIFDKMQLKYLEAPCIGFNFGESLSIYKMKIHHFTLINSFNKPFLQYWKLTSLSLYNIVNLKEYNDVLPLHTLRVDKYIPELNNDVHTLIVDKCNVIHNLQPHILHVGGNHYDILPNLKQMPELKKLVYNGKGDFKRYNLRNRLDEDMDKYHDEEYQEATLEEKIKKKVRKILPNTEIEFVNN